MPLNMNADIVKRVDVIEGNAVVEAYPKYRILPSYTIAQAILESGRGGSRLAKECHNYFGMKWRDGCGCDWKEYLTKEQRPDGWATSLKYSANLKALIVQHGLAEYDRIACYSVPSE